MSVVFHIPGPLQQLANGRRNVKIVRTPASVREALDDLFAAYPGLRDRILTEQGTVREHVNIFVDTEDVRYLDGLSTRLSDSVEIMIVPAVSGGV